MNDGKPVPVPCEFALAWGQRTLAPSVEAGKPFIHDPRPASTPVFIAQSQEDYPPEALHAGVDGIVTMSALLDPDGHLHDIHVLNPLGHGLDEAALKAASHLLLRPILLNGQPETLPVNLQVDFHLPAPQRNK